MNFARVKDQHSKDILTELSEDQKTEGSLSGGKVKIRDVKCHLYYIQNSHIF